LDDKSFQDELFTRYTTLRKTFLSEESLNQYVDSVALLVDDAQARHYERWPILGINVGTPEVDYQPDTYAGEIAKFKDWIQKRLTWLDANMPGELIVSSRDARTDNLTVLRLFPNPASGLLFIESDQAIQKIEIYNAAGAPVIVNLTGGIYSSAIDVSRLAPGLYIAKITFDKNAMVTRRFVVK